MIKRLKLNIEELDYILEINWRLGEFPQVGDFLSLPKMCDDEQCEVFMAMLMPKYLKHENFRNVLKYLEYYRWRVIERCWEESDVLMVNCRRVDPLLL